MEEGFDRTLAAARAGEEAAWRELYDALAPLVLGYLRGSRAPDPEDLAGEVFVQLVRDLPRFRGDWHGLRGWTLTIARNRLLDARRRAARRPPAGPAEAPEAEHPGGDVTEDAAARLALERVVDALATLSDDQRDVILLRVVGDLSVEEAARALGKRTGAVKQLQRRGLAALRRRLERAEAIE